MNKKNISEMFLYGLLTFGTIGSSELVGDQFLNGDVCPNLAFIPACYIILGAFIILLFLHVLKANTYYFYGIVAIPIAIALYGTISQILGGIECPKTESGIPMCFISLALFSSITLCKYIVSKK